MNTHYDIFISYRRDGSFETAKHLNDLLVHDGYTVSFDIDTLREGPFDETLLKRIEQCVDFIIVVDKHTFDRTLDPTFDPRKDWLRVELAHALKLKKNIIPVLLSGVNGFPANLPKDIAEISSMNGPEYNRYYFDEFYRRLKFFLRCVPRDAKKMDGGKGTVNDNNPYLGKCEPAVGHLHKRKLLIQLAVVIASILLGGILQHYLTPNELLIFAGGGSVRNYLSWECEQNVADYPHAIYANLASGSAWALLAEEAARYQEDGQKNKNNYSTICLSADTIDPAFINEKTKSMFKDARIIRYYLGEDPLVVYIHHDVLPEGHPLWLSETITADSLCSIVKWAISNRNKVRLFTTSKTSGTLRQYQSCFRSKDKINLETLLDSSLSYLFYFQSTSEYINSLDQPNMNMPYIILGSKYYYPEVLRDEKGKPYREYKIIDGGKYKSKPMNLYFVGYKDEALNSNYVTIRKPIVQFLKKIGAEKTISDNQVWKDLLNGRKKVDGGDIIQDLN